MRSTRLRPRPPRTSARASTRRGCARAVERAAMSRTLDGLAVEIEGEGAGELPARRGPPLAAGVRALRAGRALPLSLRQPHPARARAGLERGHDRLGLVGGSRCGGGGSQIRPSCWSRAPSSRGTSTTWLPRCTAGPVSPGRTTEGRGRRGSRPTCRSRRCSSFPPLARTLRVLAATFRSPSVITMPPSASRRRRCSVRRSRAGTPTLLRDAFHDRLHEQYRTSQAPLLEALREGLPDGAAGVTLSGSGPSVVVWAEPDRVDSVVAALEQSVPSSATVLPLRVAQLGAHVQ